MPLRLMQLICLLVPLMPTRGSVTHRFTSRYAQNGLFEGELTERQHSRDNAAARRLADGDDAAAANATEAQALMDGEFAAPSTNMIYYRHRSYLLTSLSFMHLPELREHEMNK